MIERTSDFAEIESCLESAGNSLVRAYDQWMPEHKGTHEANVALHLTPPLLGAGFSVFAEVGLPGERREVMDLVAVRKPSMLIGLETKSLWNSRYADAMYSKDLHRMARILPELASELSIRRWCGILAALCRKPSIVEWWKDPAHRSRPRGQGRSTTVWTKLGHALGNASSCGTMFIRPGTDDGRKGELWLLYAVFPMLDLKKLGFSTE